MNRSRVSHASHAMTSGHVMTRHGAKLLMAVALLTLSGVSAAQPPKGKPPQQALEACASKQVGDQCSMQIPQEDSLVPGHCIAPPSGGPGGQSDDGGQGDDGAGLACLPDDAKEGGKH